MNNERLDVCLALLAEQVSELNMYVVKAIANRLVGDEELDASNLNGLMTEFLDIIAITNVMTDLGIFKRKTRDEIQSVVANGKHRALSRINAASQEGELHA